jgi:hypothetical protein
MEVTGRLPNGRLAPGHTVTLKHGRYSQQMQAGRLPEQATIAAIVREQVAQVVDELGGPAQVTTVKRGLIEDWAKLTIFAATLEQRLEQGGLLTPKGRTRAACMLWLSILDRRMKVAQRIGLARVAKATGTLEDVVAALTARKAAAPTDPDPSERD